MPKACVVCGKERGNGRKYCRDCKLEIVNNRAEPVYQVRPTWVYVIWHTDGGMYIGQTCDLDNRHHQHLHDGLEGDMCAIQEFPSEALARQYETEMIVAHPVENIRRSI